MEQLRSSWLTHLNPLTDPSSLSVYILIFHGSSDPRSRSASEALTSHFRDRVSSTQPAVGVANKSTIAVKSDSFSSLEQGTSSLLQAQPFDPDLFVHAAYLECHPLPLHQQIEQIAQQIQAKNPLKKISLRLLPVFLLPGVHLLEDIPAEVAQAQHLLGDSMMLTVTAHLGSQLGLGQLLNERISPLPMDAWILLAHGSRRLNANQPIAALANDIGATVAYWSTPPNLESRLQECVRSGYQHIGILPYFLFPGGITDAIAQAIAQFSQQHSTLKITLAEPLNASPRLVDLLIDLANE
ncbi:sirohydrochlorin chelatase [Phormidium sp. CLA17]|uniref:sirohydrochlorin chelatase n=1 Tax=Leptolyngbya sp. Cla-17 TaxID=2803751 RepID=UPI001491CE6E|nr:CbiX/SirB N-terminal domain-containing protein [Leptolyngbya sp. Cla-17]MBM0741345.1 sirohydrochlorin chelatase [Leptolyngbya sp. Cla-17]